MVNFSNLTLFYLSTRTSIFLVANTLLMFLWPVCPRLVAIILSMGGIAVCVFIEPDGIIRALVLGETGGVDLSTAVVFAFASLLMFYAFLFPSVEYRSKWYLVFGIVFFFAAGEESSWLQHFIKYKTPEMIEGINVQGEMSLHNIGSSRLINDLFLMASAFLFLVCPTISCRQDSANTALRIYFGVFAVYFLVRLLMPSGDQADTLRLFHIYALGISGTMVFLSSFIWDRVSVTEVWKSFTSQVYFGPYFRLIAWMLFTVYVIYGIRFQSLADLRWVPEGVKGYTSSIDDELLEFYSAHLALFLAWRQIFRKEA